MSDTYLTMVSVKTSSFAVELQWSIKFCSLFPSRPKQSLLWHFSLIRRKLAWRILFAVWKRWNQKWSFWYIWLILRFQRSQAWKQTHMYQAAMKNLRGVAVSASDLNGGCWWLFSWAWFSFFYWLMPFCTIDSILSQKVSVYTCAMIAKLQTWTYRKRQGHDSESAPLVAKITKKFWVEYGDTNESFITITETVSYSININDKNNRL